MTYFWSLQEKGKKKKNTHKKLDSFHTALSLASLPNKFPSFNVNARCEDAPYTVAQHNDDLPGWVSKADLTLFILTNVNAGGLLMPTMAYGVHFQCFCIVNK